MTAARFPLLRETTPTQRLFLDLANSKENVKGIYRNTGRSEIRKIRSVPHRPLRRRAFQGAVASQRGAVAGGDAEFCGCRSSRATLLRYNIAAKTPLSRRAAVLLLFLNPAPLCASTLLDLSLFVTIEYLDQEEDNLVLCRICSNSLI